MHRFRIKSQKPYFIPLSHDVINNAHPTPSAHASPLPSQLSYPAGTAYHITGVRSVDQILLQVALFIIVQIIGELP